jgi:hypothetical protein
MKELIDTVDKAIELLSEQEDINIRSIAMGLKIAVERARPELKEMQRALERVRNK